MRGSSRHGPSRPSGKGGRVQGARGEGRSSGRRAQPGPGAGTRDREPAGRGGRAGGHGPAAQGARAGSIDSGRLTGVVGPVVRAAGMDLESVRVTTAGRRLLVRVVVDADGGVALDDVANISREIAGALDSSTVMGEAPYTLEVSSPGVDRPLTEPRHWRRAVGRLVDAPLEAGAGRDVPVGSHARTASLRGRVVEATDHGVTLDVEGARRMFAYEELGPGTVQVEFGRMAQEPGQDGGEPDGH